uniref:Uncharacterized protein n=1 Tax=Arundo donax TaxID=35708 RepID=A0A0A9GH56_ARUDO
MMPLECICNSDKMATEMLLLNASHIFTWGLGSCNG